MATLADLRTRVEENLYSSQLHEHPFVTTIDGAFTTETAIDVFAGDGESFYRGDVIEFDTGERAYVASVSGDTLTVHRGYANTSIQNIADGSFATKNPRFTLSAMDRAITSTIEELENYGVHVWGENTITVSVGTYMYDLEDTDLLPDYGVLSLYHEEVNTGVPWNLPSKFHRTSTGLSAEGYSLEVWDFGELADGGSLTYIYAKRIDAPDDLLPRQEEIVVNGATAKLLPKTAAPRTQDPGRHTDRTVQPGQGIRDGQWYFAVYERQARSEAANIAVERTRFPNSVTTNRARRWAW